MAIDYRRLQGLSSSDLDDLMDDDDTNNVSDKIQNKNTAEERNREKSFKREIHG